MVTPIVNYLERNTQPRIVLNASTPIVIYFERIDPNRELFERGYPNRELF